MEQDEQVNSRDNNKNGGRGKTKGKGPRKGTKSDGNNDKIKNPCKLSGHSGHDWKDCFNNPKSDKFKGTARKLSDYDSEGKLKKAKQESY